MPEYEDFKWFDLGINSFGAIDFFHEKNNTKLA